jgi:hypothetical protein
MSSGNACSSPELKSSVSRCGFTNMILVFFVSLELEV